MSASRDNKATSSYKIQARVLENITEHIVEEVVIQSSFSL